MKYIIIEFLEIVIETLLVCIFFQPTKSKFRKYLYTFSVLFLLIFLYLFLGAITFVVIDMLTNTLLIILLLEEKWYEKIFSFLFVYIFTSFIFQGFVILNDIIWNLSVFVGMDSILGEILVRTFIAIFLFALLLVKIKKKYYFCLSLLNKFILVVLTSLVSLFLTLLQENRNVVNSHYLRLFAIISIIAITAITFYLISVSEKNRQIAQNTIQSKYITTLKSYYAEIAKNEVELRKIRHDIKNHIQVLTGLIDSSDYERAQNYLKQINDYALSKIVTVPNTGNLLLNAILLEKTYEFPDVIINFRGALKADISITDYDLTTIMGNLLDNALEYSRLHHFPDITLCIYQENSALLINLSNLIHGYINMKQFGKHSSKSERGHGYGISNVEEAIHKYHGHLQYTQENDSLTATVRLLLK